MLDLCESGREHGGDSLVSSAGVREQRVQRSWWSTAAAGAFVLFTIIVAVPQCVRQTGSWKTTSSWHKQRQSISKRLTVISELASEVINEWTIWTNAESLTFRTGKSFTKTQSSRSHRIPQRSKYSIVVHKRTAQRGKQPVTAGVWGGGWPGSLYPRKHRRLHSDCPTNGWHRTSRTASRTPGGGEDRASIQQSRPGWVWKHWAHEPRTGHRIVHVLGILMQSYTICNNMHTDAVIWSFWCSGIMLHSWHPIQQCICVQKAASHHLKYLSQQEQSD